MPTLNQAHRPRRGLLWLLFRAPGALVLWWQYHFPKEGEVRASARRKGNPIMELLYSLAFWAFIAAFIWMFVRGMTAHG